MRCLSVVLLGFLNLWIRALLWFWIIFNWYSFKYYLIYLCLIFELQIDVVKLFCFNCLSLNLLLKIFISLSFSLTIVWIISSYVFSSWHILSSFMCYYIYPVVFKFHIYTLHLFYFKYALSNSMYFSDFKSFFKILNLIIS